MTLLNDRLQARRPSLQQQRSDRHLLVWGELGQWLVVDEDVAFLLECFAVPRWVGDVVRDYAERAKRPLDAVEGESLAVIEALVERGILSGSSTRPAQPRVEPLRLANLTFNITNRCNLRCPWCYNPRSALHEVAVADLVRWLAEGAGALDRNASLIILGGEPFLDEPRLLDAVLGARPYIPGEILISTNGTQASQAAARSLAQCRVTVQVSLDSAQAEKHDALRGTGVFHQAVTTTRRLIDAQVDTLLSLVMTRDNAEEFEAYFELGQSLGVREVRFIPLRRIGRGVAQADRTPDLYDCFQRLIALLRRRPEFSHLLHRDFFSILMAGCRFSRLRDNCGIARRCLFIDADGSLFPCPNHRAAAFGCGHIEATPLAGLLETCSVLQSLRTRYCVAAMPTCSQCTFRYWCAGDCRAEAYAVTGQPDAPSPYCEFLQWVIPELFWLIAEGWQGLGQRQRELQPWT